MIRAAWRSFWAAFRVAFLRALVGAPPYTHQTDAEAITSDWRVVSDNLMRVMLEAEAEVLATIPEDRRAEAQERLHDAMRRYGFTERDRRHQAGRES